MNKLYLGLVLLLFVSSCQNASRPPAGEETAPPAKDGVFIHITKGVDSPHEVLMPLWLAGMMVEEHDVLVFFDIKGIEIVLNDSPDLQMEPFSSSHQLIKGLIEKGSHVMVCPGCLEVAGKSMADVMEGVKQADKSLFFGFTKGRILTLDY